MITDAFAWLGIAMWKTTMSILPTGGAFPQVFHTAAITLGKAFYALNAIVPISDMVFVVSLILTLEIAHYTFKVLRIIISHLPFIGGK